MEPFVVPEEYHRHLDSHTIAVLERWVNHGGDLSGFYWCLFSGDYLNAACVASGSTFTGFATLLRFLKISAPEGCFGSPEKVNAWRGLVPT